jgi:2,4-dienoyl-CoA reductase (NADPH2)
MASLIFVDFLPHQVGERVAIIGAGGIGFDVAEFLAHGDCMLIATDCL